MASISHEPNGRRTIQFIAGDRRRKSIRLGKVSRKDAEAVRTHAERLVTSVRLGNPIPGDTVEWLRTVSDELHDRLAIVGLVPRRESATLKAFIDGYRDTRADWSKGMRLQFNLAARDAERFFGADHRLETITRADADAFRASLAVRLSVETVRKRLRLVKHVFRVATRARLIAENPFADQRTANRGNRERMQYIAADTITTVADELTGDNRVILLLARFAGFRIPSEAHALCWTNVDFDRETVRVFSRKTKSSRTVPLIPVLRDELLKAFDRAAEGAECVLQRRQPLPPIRRAVESAIQRAGLTAWPRLFQQLRASFATDCVRTLSANVAAAILGHSAKVAAEHYWMTEAHDLEQAGLALRQALPGGALQNPVQYPTASGRAESHEPEPEPAQARRNDDVRENAAPCETHETASMGAAGFEPA